MSSNEDGGKRKKLIFRPWRTHPTTGAIIRPKNGKVFPMWVDEDEQDS